MTEPDEILACPCGGMIEIAEDRGRCPQCQHALEITPPLACHPSSRGFLFRGPKDVAGGARGKIVYYWEPRP
jgi:hypothetical protein